MRRQVRFLALLGLMLGLILHVPATSAENGPEIDLLRYRVIATHPNDRLISMLTGTADTWCNLIRSGDIGTLISNGFTVTSTPGFHLGFVAYNIRDTATITTWSLDTRYFTVGIRHELFRNTMVTL